MDGRLIMLKLLLTQQHGTKLGYYKRINKNNEQCSHLSIIEASWSLNGEKHRTQPQAIRRNGLVKNLHLTKEADRAGII